MADLSSSLTVTFGQPVASYNLSLSGGDESAPAVYRYIRAKSVRSEEVPGTFGLVYRDVVTEHIEWVGTSQGRSDIKLTYDGPEAIRLEVIRGSGFVTGGSWASEWNETVIRFAGQNTLQVETADPPVILYTSEFRDEAGNLVNAPVWNETTNAFHHDQVVYGAFIIKTSSRYRHYTVFYDIPDFCMVMSESQTEARIGSTETYTSHPVATGTTLDPVVVAAITNKNFAITSISRSVDARDETVELTAGQKVEISREGFVDRVFPTPPKAKPKPPKDPVTGRTDYMDVERTTRIRYSTQYTDQTGMVRATLHHSESQNNEAPKNAYSRWTFWKSGINNQYRQIIDDSIQPYYEPPLPPAPLVQR